MVVVAFGAWLRLRQANEPFWLDELHTAWVVGGEWSEVAPRAAIGNQSPLYFYAAAVVQSVFGDSDLALRSLSLLAGIALPAAVWWLLGSVVGREECATSERSARSWSPLLAAWLIAVDPTNIFYSVEARPYALVQLLTVMHFGLLLKLLDRPTIALRAAWVAGAALLFYLHYTAGLMLIAELVVAVVVRSQWFGSETSERHSMRTMIVDWSAVGVLLLPAAGHLLQIHERRANWAVFIDRFDLWQLASAPSAIAWSGAAGYWIAALLLQRWRPKPRDSRTPGILLAWLLIPLIVAALASATDWLRLWFPRYLLAATPAAAMLAALLPRLVRGWGSIVVAATLALSAAAISHAEVDWRSLHGRSQRNEDWQAAIDYLNREAPDDEVLLWSGLIESDAVSDAATNEVMVLRDYCCYPLTARHTLHAKAGRVHALPLRTVGQVSADLKRVLRPTADVRGFVSLVVRGGEEQAALVVAELAVGLQRGGLSSSVADVAEFGRVRVVRLRIEVGRP